MYGAIIGDIIGSRFEFDQEHKVREFELFTDECDITDDTVMTVAVAQALIEAGPDAGEAQVKAELIRSMKKWGQKYPVAGYGSRFIDWVLSEDPEPYGSYGNGSGMRVSAAGWLYGTIERTREVARWTAEVTHNHPEGVKGAESVAAAIFMARHGATQQDIKEYIVREFSYDLSRTLDEIRPGYYHVEDCMRTMPEAFTCFLEADSYESTIRNVMYIGGDTDTLGAIAGAIAEAFWGVPVGIIADALPFIPEDIRDVISMFRDIVDSLDGGRSKDDPYRENLLIKLAAQEVMKTRSSEDFVTLVSQLIVRINDGGEAPTPMTDVNNVMSQIDLSSVVLGGTFKLDQDVRLRIAKFTDGSGRRWVPLFTEDSEVAKSDASGVVMNMPIRNLICEGYNVPDVEGVVINPFSECVHLDKKLLKVIVEHIE